MRLAILIPTFNRGAFLRRAVLGHLEQLRALRLADVEIVISDNVSDGGSRKVAEELARAAPELRLLQQAQHHPTAEEHIFAAVAQLEHDYIWTFGDDDIPTEGALAEVYRHVRQAEAELLIGNIRAFHATTGAFFAGKNSHGGIVDVEKDVFGSAQDLIRDVGYQSVAACASALVFRREVFVTAPFQNYAELSPIYAHVACCLDAFAGRPAAFIARPVVDYRFGAAPHQHWQDYASSRRALVNRPWTTGIARQLELLQRRGKIDPDFLVRTREHHPEHAFALWAHMLHRVVEDMESGAWAELGPRQGARELDRICGLLSSSRSPAPLEVADRIRTLWLAMVEEADGPRALRAASETHQRVARFAPVREMLAPALGAWPAPRAAADYKPGDWIDFSRSDSQRYLLSGFSLPEEWGRWTDGRFARLAVSARDFPLRPVLFEAELVSLFKRPEPCEEDAPRLWVGDGAPLRLTGKGASRISLPVDRVGARTGDEFHATIAVGDPKQPQDAPVEDGRALGVGLARVRFVPR